MESERVSRIIREDVPKEQIIDLADAARASRKLAGEYTLKTGLTGQSANRIAGMTAYELMEMRLREVIEARGGLALEAGCFPGTALRNYQSVGKHGRVLIGRASISEIGALPSINITRSNGAMINWHYGSQPYLDGFEPPCVDELLYMLILTCRDPHSIKTLAEVAVGVLEPDFSGFILYEPIDKFISGYGDRPTGEPPRRPVSGPTIAVSLKPNVKPFVGGEVDADGVEGEDKAG